MSTSTQRAVNRVKDRMREGGLLMRMHNTAYGRRWYILPGPGAVRSKPAREVEDHIAQLVLKEPDVFPNQDGIWAGCDQTYRIGEPT